MRLVCPRCGAQYEIDDDAIPSQGRDVECSSCDHVWRAVRPFDPGARPTLSRPLNDSVLDILRQEAARELEARAAERAAERAVERTAVALAQFQRPRNDDTPDRPAPDDEGGAVGTPGARIAPDPSGVTDAWPVGHPDQPGGSPEAHAAPDSAAAGVPPSRDDTGAAAHADTLPDGPGDAIPRRRSPAAAAVRPAPPHVPAAPPDSLRGRRDPRAGTDALRDGSGSVARSGEPSGPPLPRAAALSADPAPYPAAHPAPHASAGSRARARRDAGFHVAVMVALVAVALYVLAPRLANHGPMGARLSDWHAQVNTGRDWLAVQADRLIGNAATTMGSAPE